MVTNSLRFVSWKDYKTVTKVLKEIYQTITEENALMNLETFEKNGQCRSEIGDCNELVYDSI